MSQTTKWALSASLKKLMTEKPLDKITVADVTKKCGVHRKTFYYHYRDILDLLEWIFTTEAIEALNGKKTYDTWQQGYLQILEYVQKNYDFIMNTYHSLSREYLEQYLYGETENLLMGVLQEKDKKKEVSGEDKVFIIKFYKYSFVGLTLDWIGNGMKELPERLVERLGLLIYGDFTKALEAFARKK